jgi:hemerythrin
MKRFELTDALRTGLTDIDEDHREIFEAGNRIASPSFINSDSKTLEEVLSFLEDYVLYHFAAEEYAMSNEGFHGMENHCKLHKNFQHNISGYVNTFRTEGISKELILKISFAIEDWLIEHIRITDHDFARFLKRNNVESVHLPGVKKLKEKGMLPKNFNERIAPNR